MSTQTKPHPDPPLSKGREPKAPTHIWQTPPGPVRFDGRCLIMGILNVTRDSFSDGGLYADPDAAVVRGIQMAAEGADVIDVGGESTRPGARPVEPDVQMQRVLPVISRLRAER